MTETTIAPRTAAEAVAREFFLAESDDRAWAKQAWADMGGSEPSDERAHLEITATEALKAAAPLLTVTDVPHLAAQIRAQVLREAAEHLRNEFDEPWGMRAADRIEAL